MSATRNDPVAKAHAAWGEAMPPEVLALATACRGRTQRALAKQLGYSDATISYVLSNNYAKGDLPKVFAKIRGALMGETVMCPVYDEISRARCIDVQALPFAPTNPARVRAFFECPGCEHRLQKDAA